MLLNRQRPEVVERPQTPLAAQAFGARNPRMVRRVTSITRIMDGMIPTAIPGSGGYIVPTTITFRITNIMTTIMSPFMTMITMKIML